MRLHVFQGERIPAADDDGSIDPFLVVKFNGQKTKTSKLLKTEFPRWYETLTFDVDLPPLRFAPQVKSQQQHHAKLCPCRCVHGLTR